jgi:hypothetical protein
MVKRIIYIFQYAFTFQSETKLFQGSHDKSGTANTASKLSKRESLKV